MSDKKEFNTFKELSNVQLEEQGEKKLQTCMGLAFYEKRAVLNVRCQSKWREMLPVARCYQAEYTESGEIFKISPDEQAKFRHRNKQFQEDSCIKYLRKGQREKLEREEERHFFFNFLNKCN